MNVFEDRHVESYGKSPVKIYTGTFLETGAAGETITDACR